MESKRTEDNPSTVFDTSDEGNHVSMPKVRHIRAIQPVSYSRWEVYAYCAIGIAYGLILGYELWGHKKNG